MSLPPSREEWLRLVEVGGFPTYDPVSGGHLIVVSQPDLIQARCYCGWHGPDRTGDPHAAGLVLDDTVWHCHHEDARCPDEGCLTCWEEPRD